MTPLTATLGAALAASLIGSLHCAAMCGGFAALCGGADRRPLSIAAYNFGRLASYLTLGALAGLLAGRFEAVATALTGIQHLAAVALIAVIALVAWRTLRPAPVRIEDPRGPLARLRAPLARLLRRRGPGPALAVGLLTAALPCGWLWGFVAVAGATTDPLAGALVMAAFWLGTVPALTLVGALARLLGARARRYSRPLTALALLLAAGVAYAGRTDAPPAAPPPAAASADPTCH